MSSRAVRMSWTDEFFTCCRKLKRKIKKPKPLSSLERIRTHGNQRPSPRSGHRMCADKNYLYVFGGYDPLKGNRLYNELWRYNISTDKWLKLPDKTRSAPLQCTSTAMILWRRKIIVFGGSGFPFTITNSNHLYVYCLDTFQWIDLNEMSKKINKNTIINSVDHGEESPETNRKCFCKVIPLSQPPLPKYGHCMSLHEDTGEIFVFSGTTGHAFTDEFHKFNLNTLTWYDIEHCAEHKREKSCGRFRHEVVWNSSESFIFGGRTLKESSQMDTIHSFDFEKYKWMRHECRSDKYTDNKNDKKMKKEFPCARKAHSCVMYDDSVYMIGGIKGNIHLDDIWRFDLNTKTWHNSNKLKFPRKNHFHASAVTEQGCMYVFGGIDKDNMRKNDLHKMWLCAPSLKEQAWMKVAKTLRKQKRLNNHTLTQLGVPKEFQRRINDGYMAAG